MKQKMIAMLLILTMLTALFTGCRTQNTPGATPDTAATETGAPGTEDSPGDLPAPVDLGLTDFDNGLVEYLRLSGLRDRSFTVSPLSFKAALALAAEGAEGETLDQLLKVLGFASLEELEAWYQTVLAGVDSFEQYFEDPWTASDDAAYQVVNSIWQNNGTPGEFLDAYVQRVGDLLRAETHAEDADKITAAINAWVKEKTKGLIPSIVNDASDCASVLVNALYLKTAWVNEFHESDQTDFTKLDGQKIQKEFMQQQEQLRYYEDENCQLVVLPLQGGVNMVLILGDAAGLAAKLEQAEPAVVRVTVPKFTVESTYDQGELCGYLRSCGCSRALTGEAEFSKMFTESICVDDIIQKAKVKVDEKGLEAAAATAIIMKNAGIMPVEPKLFLADHPFTFCIFQGETNPELLFYGQVAD